MNLRRHLIFIICSVFFGNVLRAQDIVVTVTPVSQVLTPFATAYVSSPGNYFTVSLTNTSGQTQNVYLGLEIEQVSPASDLHIITPPKRQPKAPFIIPANGSYTLSMSEMKGLFDHIPSNEISAPANLFNDFSNGSFGLLPEGLYQVHITAYQWNPELVSPVVMSDPYTGTCMFTVCYKAQAPEFIMPMLPFDSDDGVALLDVTAPIFTWKAPLVACNPSASRFKYRLRIVELLPNQQPDDAIDHNTEVYQTADYLLSPMFTLSKTLINARFFTNRTYVARVTAYDNNSDGSFINWTSIENSGRSNLLLFRLKVDVPEMENENDDIVDDNKKQDDDEEKQDDDDEGRLVFGQGSYGAEISDEALYTYKNPQITTPSFNEEAGARKWFLTSDIIVRWIFVKHIGGAGEDYNSHEFNYEVQLFNGHSNTNREEVVKGEPIYSFVTDDDNTVIKWDDFKDKVEKGDYVLLRVKPVCTNEKSIAYVDDCNIIDFGMCELLSKKYFQCTDMAIITNTEPTLHSAKKLKGLTVDIGEYKMVIDEVSSGDAKNGFTGKGRVWWRPMGFDIGVCVKFENLKINTEDRVFSGTAASYSNDPQSNNDVTEKLFSDWGVNQLIGEQELACADQLQQGGAEESKGLAEQLDISKYYKYIRAGKCACDLLTKGKIEELYMPLGLPEDINQSPCDIQIVGMKFEPTHATMNIMAEFVIDDCAYTDNEILVFGLPRVCISPNRLLPEGGTLALLRDFTVKDPNSTYTCTFKAPTDLLQPTNGCFLSWADNKFELLGIDVDMSIPGLKKEVNGVLTNEQPSLHIQTEIESWDEWLVPDISMDAFQADDLPGWTFTAKNIVIDHHSQLNSDKMGAFPKGYDKTKAFTGSDVAWQGVFIKELSVKFPKAMEMGDEVDGDRRFSIEATDMFFDKSGATLAIDANQLLKAKTGKMGGWGFSLDNVGLKFVQNDFSDCHFSGTIDVPLIEGSIGYACNVYKLKKQEQNDDLQYAYVFKTQQTDKLNLDFFAAKASFNKDQTYLLVEATPENGKLQTHVELMMGGTMTIGGDAIRSKLNIKEEFELPGIVFSQLRIANCKEKAWTSVYEKAMQEKARKATGKELISNYEYEIVKNKCYISRGAWGLASPPKRIGPFEFTLQKFDLTYQEEKDDKTKQSENILTLTPSGKVAIVEGIDLTAAVSLSLKAKVDNTGDLSNLKITFKKPVLNDIELNSTFADCVFNGRLHHEAGDKEGYSGNVEFRLPGDFLIIEASAGYYTQDKGKQSQYTWGFLKAKVGSKVGIEITPVKITSITGGFYFNCRRADKDPLGATAEKGLIGIVLGIGLSTTAGEGVLDGDFEMTCIYDKDLNGKGKGGLTSFVFNGKLKAVDGMVDGDASIVYQNDMQDQYLALNVTVDAKCDAGALAKKIEETTQKFKDKIDKLKEKGYALVSGVTGSLADKIGDNDGESGDKEDPGLEFSSEGHVALDFRITFKEKGKRLPQCKWHVYLGEPGDGKNPEADEKKRCYFHLIDFKSPIATVKIGANAYLCLGNELPNGGKLPPIAPKVRAFLDGGSKGEGVKSASLSEADIARRDAMNKALEAAEAGGGVMLGATAYGYIKLDFGLLYGSFDATAGFDIALTKFKTPQPCAQYGANMGYHDWYGKGQLYASLEADLGVRINLGFFNDSISILKGGVGGCFKFQGPNPTYFTGEARCYLSLLGGLVNIDRTYEFECGTFCKEFHGNPLDDFELFGDCMGYDTRDEGWDDKNRINPKLLSKPVLKTTAAIDQHFRLLDENELDRIEEESGASRQQLETQASRTFIFHMNPNVELRKFDKNGNLVYYKEYYYKNGYRYSNSYVHKDYAFLGNLGGIQHVIDLLDLEPDTRYSLKVSGYAKEIVNGVEKDPMTYNPKKQKYENKAWRQEKFYYFRTGNQAEIGDVVNVQDYVAIAYPSYYNQLMFDGNENSEYLDAHAHDVQYPIIALTADISGKAFKKGHLWWEWESNMRVSKKEGKVVSGTVDGKRYCLIVAKEPIGLEHEKGDKGQLRLYYLVSRSEKDKTVYDTTWVARMNINVMDNTDWQNDGHLYELPFIGMKVTEIANNSKRTGWNSCTDAELMRDDKTTTLYKTYKRRLVDPYIYLAYLSNVVFVGGQEINSGNFNVYATTSQSLTYTDKGGKYAGTLSKLDGSASNCFNDYSKIRKLSYFTVDDTKAITDYPLPYYPGKEYGYVRGGFSRMTRFTPSSVPSERFGTLVMNLKDVWTLSEKFSNRLKSEFEAFEKNWVTAYDGISRYNNRMMGCFITEQTADGKRIELPYYQVTLAWSATQVGPDGMNMMLKNLGKHNRANIDTGTMLYERLFTKKKEKYAWEGFTIDGNLDKTIDHVNATVYRVNAYDINSGNYMVLKKVNGIDANYFGTPIDYYTIYYPLYEKFWVTKRGAD